jgi:hypothetical protein
MRKSVLGIFTVAALAASVAIDVAAAQRAADRDGSRAGGAATGGGAAATQPTPPSGGGPGKLPSAGQIPAPTSAASKRADTVPATGMGKPPSPTGEGPAATRSSASASATGRVEGRATSGRAMASSSLTTDRYSGTYRRGDWLGRFWNRLAVGAATAPYWGGYYGYGPYAYGYAPTYASYGYGGPYYAAADSGPARRCYCR